MDILICIVITIIALYVFVLILLTDYKSTFDIAMLIVSGLIFYATSIYSAIVLLGLIQ